jgi:hypothetical protein
MSNRTELEIAIDNFLEILYVSLKLDKLLKFLLKLVDKI